MFQTLYTFLYWIFQDAQKASVLFKKVIATFLRFPPRLKPENNIRQNLVKVFALAYKTSEKIIQKEKAPKLQSEASIATTVSSLDFELRAVVVLKDMLSFSIEEISEITRSPVGTIKYRLNRARLNLAGVEK